MPIRRSDHAILMALNLVKAGLYKRVLIVSPNRVHYEYWAGQAMQHLDFVWNKSTMQLTLPERNGGQVHFMVWDKDFNRRVQGPNWDMSLSVSALAQDELENLHNGTRIGPLPMALGVITDD